MLLIVGSTQAMEHYGMLFSPMSESETKAFINSFKSEQSAFVAELQKGAASVRSIKTRFDGNSNTFFMEGNFNGKPFNIIPSNVGTKGVYQITIGNDSEKVTFEYKGDVREFPEKFIAFVNKSKAQGKTPDYAAFAKELANGEIKLENKRGFVRKTFNFLTSKKVLIPALVVGGIYLLS